MKFLHDFYGEPSPEISAVRRPFLNGLFFTSAGFLMCWALAKAASAPSEMFGFFQDAAIGVIAIWFCIVGAVRGFSGYYGHAKRIERPPYLNQRGTHHIAWVMHRWILLMYLIAAQLILALAFTLAAPGNKWIVIGVLLLSSMSSAVLFAKFVLKHAKYRSAVIKSVGSLKEGVARLPADRQEFIAQCLDYRWVGTSKGAWVTAIVGSHFENQMMSERDAASLAKSTPTVRSHAPRAPTRRL